MILEADSRASGRLCVATCHPFEAFCRLFALMVAAAGAQAVLGKQTVSYREKSSLVGCASVRHA